MGKGKVRDRLLKKLEQMKLEKLDKLDKFDKFDKFERWSELPPRCKTRCLEKMDFKTRFLLRSTSRKEKKLVESTEFKFEQITLLSGCNIIAKYIDSDKILHEFTVTTHEIDNFKPLVPLLAYIFKRCKVSVFDIYETNPLSQNACDEFNRLVPAESARIDNVITDSYDQNLLFFLRKCWKEMDLIEIVSTRNHFSFNEIMRIRSFDYVTTFKTSRPISEYIGERGVLPSGLLPVHCQYVNIRHFLPMIENWTVNNAPIGKKLIVESVSVDAIDTFIGKFRLFLIRHGISRKFSGYAFRMATQHPAKHILAVLHNETFRCQIISAEVEDSDYDSYTC